MNNQDFTNYTHAANQLNSLVLYLEQSNTKETLTNTEILICLGAFLVPLIITAILLWWMKR
jgi:fucose permease